MLSMCSATQIPYFNAPIFLENKTQIGKVEEILGPINNVVSKGAHACGIDGNGSERLHNVSWNTEHPEAATVGHFIAAMQPLPCGMPVWVGRGAHVRSAPPAGLCLHAYL